MDFDRETLPSALAAATCKRCGYTGAKMEVVFQGPHFARADCRQCGAFVDWIRFPEAPATRRKSRKKLRDLGERCEICLRHQGELPKPEKLTVHHVLEVEADNGADDQENLRAYCTACHSLIHWARVYFGHYHPEVVPW